MLDAKIVNTQPTIVWNAAWKDKTLARSCKKKTSFNINGTNASD